MCRLLLLLFCAVHVLTDPPEYVAHLQVLMNISAAQTQSFIADAFQLKFVFGNPSFAPWIFAENKSNEYQDMIVIWGGRARLFYAVVSAGEDKVDWQRIKNDDYVELFNDHKGGGRRPLTDIADPRIYHIPGSDSLRVTYWTSINHRQQQRYADLHYSFDLDALYIIDAIRKLDISHEIDNLHEKNWSPFIFEHKNKSMDTLFVYSILPHRVVHAKEDEDRLKKDWLAGTASIVNASTVSLTKINLQHSPEFKPWQWGHEPRGGTPAILMHTPFGLKYLSFFHSGGHYMIDWCVTYFMGAYLFDPVPPFSITDMSVDPIIPNAMYNETNGWAYKGADYLVFPMGLMATKDFIFVCTGRNDRSGWIVKLHKNNFVRSLKPVESEVLSNDFNRYFDSSI